MRTGASARCAPSHRPTVPLVTCILTGHEAPLWPRRVNLSFDAVGPDHASSGPFKRHTPPALCASLVPLSCSPSTLCASFAISLNHFWFCPPSSAANHSQVAAKGVPALARFVTSSRTQARLAQVCPFNALVSISPSCRHWSFRPHLTERALSLVTKATNGEPRATVDAFN